MTTKPRENHALRLRCIPLRKIPRRRKLTLPTRRRPAAGIAISDVTQRSVMRASEPRSRRGAHVAFRFRPAASIERNDVARCPRLADASFLLAREPGRRRRRVVSPLRGLNRFRRRANGARSEVFIEERDDAFADGEAATAGRKVRHEITAAFLDPGDGHLFQQRREQLDERGDLDFARGRKWDDGGRADGGVGCGIHRGKGEASERRR